MRIVEAKPRPDAAVLPGADFVDAWRADGVAIGESAEAIAQRLFSRKPRWVAWLLALRNLLVSPFSLKTKNPDPVSEDQGFAFPVISSRPDRVVLGMDDRHLDFRLVIDMEARGLDALAAVATTYVRTHNLGGRLYMAVIRPFHRRVVPAMLKRAAAQEGADAPGAYRV